MAILRLQAILLAAVLLAQSPCGLAASPPPQPSAAGGDLERTVLHDRRDRTYHVHIPPGYRPQRPAPVVLVFHGGLSNAATVRQTTGMDAIADAAGFVAVYPQGSGRLQNRLLTWNGGRCCGHAAQSNVDDVGFVRALLADLETVVNVDPRRIYAAGISNGALMAYRLACELSDRIAAIAAVAGTQNVAACAPLRPVPVLHIHGDRDAHVPYHGGAGERSLAGVAFAPVEESVAFWVRQNGCAAEAKVTQAGNVRQAVYAPCRQGATVRLVTVLGGGHAWPGGRPAWRGGDVPTREIDAGELAWAFFAAHPMP